MLDFGAVKRGDIVRLVEPGAPGYAKIGDLLRVTGTCKNGVIVEDKNGERAEFVYNCGAERLEATEWREDFPKPPSVEELDAILNAKDGREVMVLPDGSLTFPEVK